MKEVGLLVSSKLGDHRLEWRMDDTGTEGIIVRACGNKIWVPIAGSLPDAHWPSEIEARLDQAVEERSIDLGEKTDPVKNWSCYKRKSSHEQDDARQHQTVDGEEFESARPQQP